MQSTTHHDEDLKTALSKFENNLVTPIVSGELASWIEEVKTGWSDASAQIHCHIKHLHPRQFDEISKQDPELLPRIELLKAEDDAIEQQREQFSTKVVQNDITERHVVSRWISLRAGLI